MNTNFADFEKRIKGLNRISCVKFRDPDSSIPRGFNVYGREYHYLLISNDGSLNLYFDDYIEMFADRVVSLRYKGVEIGAINISDMEVDE